MEVARHTDRSKEFPPVIFLTDNPNISNTSSFKEISTITANIKVITNKALIDQFTSQLLPSRDPFLSSFKTTSFIDHPYPPLQSDQELIKDKLSLTPGLTITQPDNNLGGVSMEATVLPKITTDRHLIGRFNRNMEDTLDTDSCKSQLGLTMDLAAPGTTTAYTDASIIWLIEKIQPISENILGTSEY